MQIKLNKIRKFLDRDIHLMTIEEARFIEKVLRRSILGKTTN